MYVCICLGVTDKQISKAIDDGQSDVDAIKATTGAGGCCGSCVPIVESILKDHMEKAIIPLPAPLPLLDLPLTNNVSPMLSFASLGDKKNADKNPALKNTATDFVLLPHKKIFVAP